MMHVCECESPLGTLTLAGRREGLTGLWLAGQKYYGLTLSAEAVRRDIPVFRTARRWLNRYFAGKAPAIDFPLAPEGSAFRQAVWKILLAIPYGEVTTYKAISERMAAAMGRSSMSAQAVGGAVGHNSVSIIIPCHRVLGTDGGLTGYAGGLDKKHWLLRHESAIEA